MRARESYSIVISPPEKDVSSVKNMKILFHNNIGDYGSCNSKAHITMAKFIADPAELSIIIRYVNDFCLRSNIKNLEFIKFASFPTAFHLESSDDTKLWFKEFVKRFNKHFPLNKKDCDFKTSTTPHITIGRKLDALKINIAHHLFENQTVDMVFPCNSITIRKYNPTKQQYDVFSHHVFGNKSDLEPENQQLSLFD